MFFKEKESFSNYRSDDIFREFYYEITGNNLKQAKILYFGYGNYLLSQKERLNNALLGASIHGSLECAEFLLNVGADINCRIGKINGMNLHYAIANNHSQLVKLFINHGISHEILSRCLHLAIEKQNDEIFFIIAELLFVNKDKKEIEKLIDCDEWMETSIATNNLNAIKYLTEKGIQLSNQHLKQSILSNHIEMIKFCLYSCNNSELEYDESTFSHSATNGYNEIVGFLLETKHPSFSLQNIFFKTINNGKLTTAKLLTTCISSNNPIIDDGSFSKFIFLIGAKVENKNENIIKFILELIECAKYVINDSKEKIKILFALDNASLNCIDLELVNRIFSCIKFDEQEMKKFSKANFINKNDKMINILKSHNLFTQPEISDLSKSEIMKIAIDAIKSNDLIQLQNILILSVFDSCKNKCENINELFKIAIEESKFKIVEWISETFDNLNFDECLAIAIKNKNNDMIELFLTKGADPNRIIYSLCNNDLNLDQEKISIIRLIIENIRVFDPKILSSCLRFFARNDNKEGIQLFLDHGFKFEMDDALKEAMKNNNLVICKLLIESGADLFCLPISDIDKLLNYINKSNILIGTDFTDEELEFITDQ
jgi:hypothetical protein